MLNAVSDTEIWKPRTVSDNMRHNYNMFSGPFNTLRSRQNECIFTDNIFKIFIMAWHQTTDKPYTCTSDGLVDWCIHVSHVLNELTN